MTTIQVELSAQDARERLRALVKELAYRDGIDIVLSSGKRSDFYVNGKQITLHPEGLFLLSLVLLDELDEFPEVTAIGGLTLGADPIAAGVCSLSHLTGRPLSAFLVRKQPKGHGTGSRIEGTLEPGQKVAIVEDTLTTGASSQVAIDAVREIGAEPVVVLTMVDRQDSDADEFRARHCVRPVFTIADLRQA